MRDSTVFGRGGVQGYHCTAARGWGFGDVGGRGDHDHALLGMGKV